MSSEKPLLVVLGATGNQGGSIISYFLSLSPSPYSLRGVTRDPSSPKAISLAAAGVEMVRADIDDASSLDAAFKGASAIFSVTDFWINFFKPSEREKAAALGQTIGVHSREREIQMSRNIIDAAAKVSTLDYFIFSGLVDSNKLSEGKYSHVYHFEGKGLAEEYGQSTHPALWAKTSVFYAGLYLENYFGPNGAFFRPKLNQARDTLILTMPDYLARSPFPMYSAMDDTGALVHALLQTAPGKKLHGFNEWLSLRDLTEILGKVLGKKTEFVDSLPATDSGDSDFEKEINEMIGFCVEFGYFGGNSGIADKSPVNPGDLGVPVKLQPVMEWFKKQDWEKELEVGV
ncbi:hypothetical protein BJX63DRAFT_427070 [Aspergillus granulosus]|uniref:NmrA-like domain-containing protein n=1 Tax=Aspergillus granulosus TaxID=176169 RepID=A0ABR4I417_9EURO